MSQVQQKPASRDSVLVVDDEPMMLDMLREALEIDFEVSTAKDGREAVALLSTQPVTAIVADQRMPGMTGVEVLKRAIELQPTSTRIMLTASDEMQDVRAAVNEAHVDRFLSKPIRPLELVGIVKGAIKETRLEQEKTKLADELARKNVALEAAIAEVRGHEQKLEEEVVRRTRELRQLVKQLEEMALRDGLTGLYNHRFFQETLNAEISRAIRYQRRLSLLFIDVDHFKSYNDTHGHLAGDELLKQLGRILANTGEVKDLRARGRLSDIPCRYGGEEFVVILTETDKVGARVRAERVREQVQEYAFDGRETQPSKKISVSVGIASFPEDGKTKQDLIGAADAAMLRAKREGRNRVRIAGEN